MKSHYDVLKVMLQALEESKLLADMRRHDEPLMKEAPCIGIVERTEKIQHNGVPVTLDYIRCEETGTSALLQTTTRRLPSLHAWTMPSTRGGASN